MAVTLLSDGEIQRQLNRTSRTFAISIPLLPDPLRRQVGLSYLLFRIADTVEDASSVDRDNRVALLHAFAEAMLLAADGHDDWHRRMCYFESVPPCDDKQALELHRNASRVVATMMDEPAEAKSLVFGCVRKTALGMAEFVARARQVVTFVLNRYRTCYRIAMSSQGSLESC